MQNPPRHVDSLDIKLSKTAVMITTHKHSCSANPYGFLILSLSVSLPLIKGLLPRAKLLLTVGGTFFLGFWPLILVTAGVFAALYTVSFNFPLLSSGL